MVRTRAPEVDARRGRDLLDRVLAGSRHDPVTHVEQVPTRPGRSADWPDWAPELLVDRFMARGIARPWEHQAPAASLAHSGQSVVVATGTASGKSLAYQLPVLSTLLEDGKATALYLAPTKALAADQLRSLRSLVLPDVRAASFDGDTAAPERDWVRQARTVSVGQGDLLLLHAADSGQGAREVPTHELACIGDARVLRVRPGRYVIDTCEIHLPEGEHYVLHRFTPQA